MICLSDVTRNRCDVDDRSALLGFHDGNYVLAEQERATEVHSHDLRELFKGGLIQRLDQDYPRSVHQDIDTLLIPGDLSYRGRYLRFVRDIAPDETAII